MKNIKIKKKSKYTEYDRQFATQIARKIMAVELLGGKCQNCGNDNIFVLEFHHLSDKSKNVSSMFSCDIESIKKEIIKCKLLCGNCHSILHHNDSNAVRNKIKLLRIKKNNKCFRCDNTNSLCLCFHHRSPSDKKYSINKMHVCKENSIAGRHGKFSTKDIEKELKKCDVLCRNCHLIHHFNIKRYNKVKPLIDLKLQVYKQMELNKIKNIEIKNKNSNFRQLMAQYLNLWKSVRCVKRTSDILGVNYFQLRADLLLSKVFVKSIMRKENISQDIKKSTFIPLTQGQMTMVDKEDYIWLLKYRWCAHKRRKKGGFFNVVRTGFMKGHSYTINMSRAILEKHKVSIGNGMIVTHLNKNELDNRKSNLRVITISEGHRRSLRGRYKPRSTQYKWIRWDSCRNKWLSSMKIGGKYINIGRFNKEEFAAYISDREYIRNFHSSDCVNFVYTPEEMKQEINSDIPFYLFPKEKITL